MSTQHRPFRFGVQATTAASHQEWSDLARTLEDLGYGALTMPDHFTGQFAPIPALQCAADATSTLRLGTLVHANDYKHPVVLAKELATIDVLSGGRVEIGLGAGWMISDYEEAGLTYDPPGTRVDRFVEALAVIRGAMGPGPFSFEGEHYTISNYDGLPKPVQQPTPPVLIGGGGPRVLRIAARQADIVGVNATLTSGAMDHTTFESMTAEAVDQKIGVVRAAATEAGRLEQIELNVRVFMMIVGDDVDASLDTVAQFAGTTPEAVAETPYALVGPPAKLVDDLVERRERWGFSYIVVGQADIEAFAPVVAELAGR